MKYVCTVCGYVADGEVPESCPQCGAPASAFNPLGKSDGEERVWMTEHEIGTAKDLDPEVVQGLRDNFTGESTEVGMYLAMARQADREGYPEIASLYERVAYQEAEHAAKFAELLGEVVYPDTKKNLQLRADAESGATSGKLALANKAKALGYDAVHDTVLEMAKDEARHGKAFEGALNRYFS